MPLRHISCLHAAQLVNYIHVFVIVFLFCKSLYMRSIHPTLPSFRQLKATTEFAITFYLYTIFLYMPSHTENYWRCMKTSASEVNLKHGEEKKGVERLQNQTHLGRVRFGYKLDFLVPLHHISFLHVVELVNYIHVFLIVFLVCTSLYMCSIHPTLPNFRQLKSCHTFRNFSLRNIT